MAFIKNLWQEVEPIFNHGVVAALIACIAAGLLKLFEWIFPPDYAKELHEIDRLLVRALFWLFAAYTLTLLLIRLIRHIYTELSGPKINRPRAEETRELNTKEVAYIEGGRGPSAEEFRRPVLREDTPLPRERSEK
jgi:hypothetical protein